MALDNIPTLGPGGFNGNLDKVLVYKNGGSEVACSLLTLTNSALNIAGVYLDTVNQRVGIYNPSPSAMLTVGSFGKTGEIALHREIDGGRLALLSAQNGGLVISGGGQVLTMTNNYTNSIGTTQFAVSGAMWGIKGSGSTSATTSLLVQNSSGTEIFKVLDNGSTSCGLGFVIGNNQSISDNTFALNNQVLQSYNSFSIETIPGNRQIKLKPSQVEVLAANYYVGGGYSQIGVVVYDTGSYSHDNSAVLQVNSTTRGFLPPRMTSAQKNLIASPAAGLMVYDTDLNRPCFHSGSAWVTL